MEFSFPNTEIMLTINGVECTLDVGDASMQDRLIEAASAAQSATLSDGSANVEASATLREIVIAILGEDAVKQIYQDQEPNLYKDVSLILFLRKALDEAAPTQQFNADMTALQAVLGAND